MAETGLKPEEIKLVLKILKSKGLNYKLKHHSTENSKEDCLILKSVHSGTELRGKIVRSFNQGENYHWPSLNQENLAPLIDVLYIRDDLNIFLTTYQQITLKEIVHDEDFVYDARCFDRKKSYAKGIFEGLSYLHAKSCCLMNLTDDNIAISKIYDNAVITDFSCLVCSKETTRSKMKVPDMYKAPESEKGDFDAIAAEMWASGTLMLDMFLAHMVPWPAVNYKPNKVMQIVEMLDLDVLQLANPGSIVTEEDLVKFKTFLKCFFKQNPATRVSATNASYASFLQPYSRNKSYRQDFWDRTVFSDINQVTQNVHVSSNGHSNNLDFSCSPKLTTNMQCLSKSEASPEIPVQIEHFDSKNICGDIINCSEQTHDEDRLEVIASITPPNTPRKMDKDEIGVSKAKTSKNILSNRGKGSQLIPAPLPFLYESEDLCTVSEIPVGVHKKTKSCQAIQNGTNTFYRSDCTRYQSKSLSFVKSKPDEIKISVIRSQTISCSSSKSVSEKQSSSEPVSLKNDLCFKDIFGNHDVKERLHRSSKDEGANQTCSFEVTRTEDGRVFGDHIPIRQVYQPDLGKIKNQIIFISKCQYSLREHLSFFVSNHFSYRCRKLIQEYQLLLHQEKLRLYKKLKMKYRLKLDNHMKLRRPLNSGLKNAVNHYQNLTQTRNKIPSHNSWQSRFSEAKETKCKAIRDAIEVKGYTDKFKDDNSIHNFQLNRNNSYYKAIENSVENAGRLGRLGQTNEKSIQTETIFSTVYTSEDKLIEPEMFMRENTRGNQKAKIEKKDKAETDMTEKNNRMTVKNDNIENDSSENGKTERNKEKTGKKNKAKSSDNGKVKKNKKEKTGKKNKAKSSDNGKVKKNKKVKNGKKDKPSDSEKANKIKRPFFFTLCPGGKVESETLCEACKLQYDFI